MLLITPKEPLICNISCMGFFSSDVSSILRYISLCWNWGRIHSLSSFLQYFHFVLFQTLEGISDIRDESDRSGMRIVVEVLIRLSSCIVFH